MGDEPLALVLPIKPEPKAARAVKAYFAECDNDATAEADKLRAELAQAQNELSAVRGDLNRATNKIAELEAQQAAPAAEQPEPKTAAELIAARFADLAGVTTTIKGAQTAAPVVWLAGDTERHADAIKAAGAKWSNKNPPIMSASPDAKRAAGAIPAPLPPGRGRSWAKTQIQNREVSTMAQPKIYAAVLNHFGSLSDLAATLGATVVDETLCFSGLTGQAVSDLMEQHGLDYNYSGTPEAAKEADQ